MSESQGLTLEQIKARAGGTATEAPVRAAAPAGPKPKLSAEREAEIARYAKDFAAVNQPDLVASAAPLDPNVRPAAASDRPVEQERRSGSLFDTKARRDATEKRCRPMDFGDLVMTNRVTQDVPVLEGKLTVRFQSLTGEESFWLEREMRDRVRPGPAGGGSAAAWTTYARLALSVHSINGTPLEPHITHNNGVESVDDKAAEKRIHQVLRLGERMVEMLLVNLGWFEERVSQLFEEDFAALKNG